MSAFDQLLKKRDAAAAELHKWQTIVDTLRAEIPTFEKAAHRHAVKTMNGAHTRARLAPLNTPPALEISKGGSAAAMRRRWQDPKQRAALLRAVRKGTRAAAKARKAKARTAKGATS